MEAVEAVQTGHRVLMEGNQLSEHFQFLIMHMEAVAVILEATPSLEVEEVEEERVQLVAQEVPRQ